MYDVGCTMYETLVRTINDKLNQISSNVTLKVPHLPILPMNDVKKSSKHANFPKVTNFWKVFQNENYGYFNIKSASFTSRELLPTKILNLPVSNRILPSPSK
jgi:hypothetical protein